MSHTASTASATAAPLDPTLTVNEMMTRHPETVEVFNRFGLDTCCGGGAPIIEAARRDGADPAAVLEALLKATTAT
jgi:iron-sulfur cluster repair protein YtfE (RIC family)